MKKDCGILLHISSLPGKYGIGDLGQTAYAFADFLHEAGQTYWQVLPLNPTSYGDSPYQSSSAFAGNPYFIDLESLHKEGLLTADELISAETPQGNIDYGRLFSTRLPLLEKAYNRFTPNAEYAEFCRNNADWLEPYALYCALKESSGRKPHWEWDEKRRFFNSAAVQKFAANNEKKLGFTRFLQFEFSRQWHKLKRYVNSLGIKIIGDAPIYTAYDSADFWQNPNMFAIDESGKLTEVAGVPPDYFSADGQLWGNPLYNWDYLKEHEYKFWTARISRALELFDYLRIDHFMGFSAYYAIPSDKDNARVGTWRNGPGKALFGEVARKLGNVNIIAEDLGVDSPELRAMLKDCGFPGMKVVQFGFDGEAKYNAHAVSNFTENAVGYTGTHDNDTALGWFNALPAYMHKRVRARLPKGCGDVAKAVICALFGSKAKTAIVPIQDWLREGSESRMNTPGEKSGNWRYRIKEIPPRSLALEIKQTAARYKRLK